MTSAAGSISAQWKGAETESIMARRAPLPLAISIARSTADLCPETTTWPGALSLATSQTSSAAAASAATASAAARSSPRSAAIAPTPSGTAFCMASPRMRRSRAASPIERLPAAASAEYSPSEWPATKAACEPTEIPSRFERAHGGQADRHQCRLGVARARQGVLRAREDDCGKLLAERLVDLVENRAGRGNRVRERLSHADCLAPLAGEQECQCH